MCRRVCHHSHRNEAPLSGHDDVHAAWPATRGEAANSQKTAWSGIRPGKPLWPRRARAAWWAWLKDLSTCWCHVKCVRARSHAHRRGALTAAAFGVFKGSRLGFQRTRGPRSCTKNAEHREQRRKRALPCITHPPNGSRFKGRREGTASFGLHLYAQVSQPLRATAASLCGEKLPAPRDTHHLDLDSHR